ncbi:unnamed protein product, partial [Ceratitis capitata]
SLSSVSLLDFTMFSAANAKHMLVHWGICSMPQRKISEMSHKWNKACERDQINLNALYCSCKTNNVRSSGMKRESSEAQKDSQLYQLATKQTRSTQ